MQTTGKAGTAGFIQSLVGFLLIVSIAVGWQISSRIYNQSVEEPSFGLLDVRDESSSFKPAQFKAELNAHDSIYSSCFGGTPVAYEFVAFGRNLIEAGQLTASSPRDTWPLLDKPVSGVDPSGSRLSLPMEEACRLVTAHPKRVYGVVFLSDGEATDWQDLETAVRRIARFKNLAFVVVSGVIPTSRLRLEEAMRPLGARFVGIEPDDTNQATFARLSSLVSKAGGVR